MHAGCECVIFAIYRCREHFDRFDGANIPKFREITFAYYRNEQFKEAFNV
jgi:hypothetical protein